MGDKNQSSINLPDQNTPGQRNESHSPPGANDLCLHLLFLSFIVDHFPSLPFPLSLPLLPPLLYLDPTSSGQIVLATPVQHTAR